MTNATQSNWKAGIRTTILLASLTGLLVLIGHDDAVVDVTWSPDGETIATLSADQTVRLWDAQTGAELYKFPTTRAIGNFALAWSADGGRLAVPGGDRTVVWQVPARSGFRRP